MYGNHINLSDHVYPSLDLIYSKWRLLIQILPNFVDQANESDQEKDHAKISKTATFHNRESNT